MVCIVSRNRRQFLRFLAGSPLLLQAQQAAAPPNALANAKDILDVLELEEAAHRVVPAAHWGYLSSGVDDDATQRANREGFKHIQLRPRRLVDVSKTDLKVEVFGTIWDTPIFCCPVGAQRTFHPDGEIAVARATKAKQMMQILSTQTSIGVEEVAQARGTAPWYQLYMPGTWQATEKMVRRVEAAGCPAIAWTVDLYGGRNTETAERLRRSDTRQCNACHTNDRGGTGPLPMAVAAEAGGTPTNPTWATIERLKKLTSMKVLIKGLDNRDDARLARESGADGIIVSNHGGRATETLRSTIDALPEVVDAVGSQMPVLVDGGFRRGTDIYKALALGARAVGVGRPYIWGLSLFGQAGVERVLDILRNELTMTMRQCGTPAISQITRAAIIQNARV
jgi:4-hydroxymandelate oxidase